MDEQDPSSNTLLFARRYTDTSSPAGSHDIQRRIRELLLARNAARPPKTPYPSPRTNEMFAPHDTRIRDIGRELSLDTLYKSRAVLKIGDYSSPSDVRSSPLKHVRSGSNERTICVDGSNSPLTEDLNLPTDVIQKDKLSPANAPPKKTSHRNSTQSNSNGIPRFTLQIIAPRRTTDSEVRSSSEKLRQGKDFVVHQTVSNKVDSPSLGNGRKSDAPGFATARDSLIKSRVEPSPNVSEPNSGLQLQQNIPEAKPESRRPNEQIVDRVVVPARSSSSFKDQQSLRSLRGSPSYQALRRHIKSGNVCSGPSLQSQCSSVKCSTPSGSCPSNLTRDSCRKISTTKAIEISLPESASNCSTLARSENRSPKETQIEGPIDPQHSRGLPVPGSQSLIEENLRPDDQPAEAQSFNKVINDLESLLKEALDLAGAAVNHDLGEILERRSRASESIEHTEGLSPRLCFLEPEAGGKGNKSYRKATPYPGTSMATSRHHSAVPHSHSGEFDIANDSSLNDRRSKENDFAYNPQRQQHARLDEPSTKRMHRKWNIADTHNNPYVHQIHPRSSSLKGTRHNASKRDASKLRRGHRSSSTSELNGPAYITDFNPGAVRYHPAFNAAGQYDEVPLNSASESVIHRDTIGPLPEDVNAPRRAQPLETDLEDQVYSGSQFKRKGHLSLREPKGFSLLRSHRRKPIARDWSIARKRFVAVVTCATTAMLGTITGIYAGEVPALQYVLADEHHYAILGNVVLFLGIALTTILFWPLPILHGRKPYTLLALGLLLPLQFPQALVVTSPRSPAVSTYRAGLLIPRAVAGLVMGFANINFVTILLDLFGASLQSGNPHQEAVDVNDVRRHGGGMGVWLGIWAWSSIMTIGVGFWIGASIINYLDPSWGFWISTILIAAVLLLNVLTPETRRSPYRRSMAEVRTGSEVSRRIARGEIKMHMESTGPIYWYEEIFAGYRLCLRMIRQPGFLVLAVYQGWVFGQIVMIISLLGALLSRDYHFRSQFVGLAVAIIPLGGALAIPFQKASLFSRARHHKQRTDSMTFEKRLTWTSHLVRRSTFMMLLPLAGLAYTLCSNGSVHFMAPVFFAGVIAFLTNLAIAECNGLIMETFDTSDLQPGMTGRPRRVLPEHVRSKRTNFSCFPRVTAGFMITQFLAFLIAAAGTGVSGAIIRHLGSQVATAVVAGILLLLTLLLTGALWRFKVVQVIPTERYASAILSGPEDEWKPIIIGHPSGTTRRMNILELGQLSRWTEIRSRNRLAIA